MPRLYAFARVRAATRQLAIAAAIMSAVTCAQAGVDLTGVTATGVWVDSGGNLWFTISDVVSTQKYCRNDWAGYSMFIPAADPNYAFYYGMLMSSVIKGTKLTIANISIYNGATSCDISKTGYGIAVQPAS